MAITRYISDSGKLFLKGINNFTLKVLHINCEEKPTLLFADFRIGNAGVYSITTAASNKNL